MECEIDCYVSYVIYVACVALEYEVSPTGRFGGDVHIIVIWPRGGSAEIRWDVHIDVRASVDRRAGCEFPVLIF